MSKTRIKLIVSLTAIVATIGLIFVYRGYSAHSYQKPFEDRTGRVEEPHSLKAVFDDLRRDAEIQLASENQSPHSSSGLSGQTTEPAPGAPSIGDARRQTSLNQRMPQSQRTNARAATPAHTSSKEERLRSYWEDRLRRDYDPLFAAIQLDLSKQERMLALLLDERLTTLDIFEISRKQGLNYEHHSELRDQVRAETLASIQSLLSPENLKAFQEHKGNLIAAKIIASTVNEYRAKSVPYPDDISDKLRKLLKSFPPGRFQTDPFTSHLAKKRLTQPQAAIFEEVLDKYYLRD